MANVTSRVGDSRRSNRHENRPPGQSQLCRNGPGCRKREEGLYIISQVETQPLTEIQAPATTVTIIPILCRPMAPAIRQSILSSFRASSLTDSRSNRALNVQSPAFTPTLAHARPAKPIGISPKAAAAATFTPRGAGKRPRGPEHHRRGSSLTGSSTPVAPAHGKHPSAEFVPQQSFQQVSPMIEFVPGQQFVPSSSVSSMHHPSFAGLT